MSDIRTLLFVFMCLKRNIQKFGFQTFAYNIFVRMLKHDLSVLFFRLLNESYKRAMGVLKAHRRELDLLAEALLNYETLDAEDIRWVIREIDCCTFMHAGIL